MRRLALKLAPLALAFTLSCGRADAAQPAPVPVENTAPDAVRASVRTLLAARREQAIARLHAYGLAGQFPHEYTTAPSLHVFRDAEGRLCAVANLVHADGRDDLVDATARAHNDLAVADVHDGPLLAWMLASGLTQDELVRIQVPAPRVARPAPAPTKELPVVARTTPRTDGVSEAELLATLRAHVATVEAELRASTAASLDLAVDRYLASR